MTAERIEISSNFIKLLPNFQKAIREHQQVHCKLLLFHHCSENMNSNKFSFNQVSLWIALSIYRYVIVIQITIC